MRRSRLLSSCAPFILAALSACDTTDPDRRQIDVSFSTLGSAAGSLRDGGASADITIAVGANTLIITKAQLVIRDIKLKPSAATCSDDSEGDDDCATVHVGPALVDLPLTDAIETQIETSVPEGTYRRIQLKIHKPSDDTDDAAFLVANPDFEDISIRVEGTYNGEAFVYMSDMTENIELEFSPPLVVDTDNQNLTVQVNIGSWFSNGVTVVDPRTANKGEPNESLVRNNIRASLRALEDEDRNGQ